MNEAAETLTPRWFKITSGLFLVWNLFGLAVFALTMSKFRQREALENAGLSKEQIDLTLATPAWVNIAFGVAVVFGVLGCVALVMKSQLATPLLVASLLGVLAQNTYMYFLSDTIKVMGVGASPLVMLGAVVLVPYAMHCSKRGWYR
ncbi:MAG: hypothetical protein AAFY88_07890 [Acidobacteriota bacterium]